MFAVIAAVLFAIALILEIAGKDFGPVITWQTLTTAGLMCVALHLAGAGSAVQGRYRRYRR
jgi:hypothetical protein